MNKNSRRLIISLVMIAVGVVLLALGETVAVNSPFCSGFGCGMAAVGIVMALRSVRYRKDEDYRRQVDTEEGDEQNRYIRLKAWSITGCATVLGCAAAAVTAGIAGRDETCTILAAVVFLMALVYIVSYVAVSKRN